MSSTEETKLIKYVTLYIKKMVLPVEVGLLIGWHLPKYVNFIYLTGDIGKIPPTRNVDKM